MSSGNGNQFIDAWKKLDGQFDSYERLKEMRALVAKGVVSQEVYEELHRYVIESNLPEKERKKLEKKKKTNANWQEKPVMEGFLYKRGFRAGKSWKRRYFVLYNDRLEYFKKKGDSVPRGTIQITPDLYCSDSMLRRIKNARRNGFMLSDFATTYYLAADSPESKVYWLHTIARVIKKLQENDNATDAPVMLGGQMNRTQSVRDKEYQERMTALKRTASLERRNRTNSRSSARTSDRPNSGRPLSKTSSAASSGAAPARKPRPISLTDGMGKRIMKNPELHSPEQIEKARQQFEEEQRKLAEEEEKRQQKATEKDAEEDEASESEDDEEPVTEIIESNPRISRAAVESARESVKSNLGLDIMSYAEKEELQEEAKAAAAASFIASLENEAAMNHLEEALDQEEEVKQELKQALETGDEEKIDKLKGELTSAKEKVAEIGNDVARTAAEKAESDDIAERNEKVVAEADVANAIVLELSKVDEAILKSEQLAADASAARKRAEEAAQKVKDTLLKEQEAKKAALAKAEKAAKEAEEKERKRIEEEKAIQEKLEAAAQQKVIEKQQKKATEIAEARRKAEDDAFKKQIESIRLQSERLDALAKAAAVERTLRETQQIVTKDRQKNNLNEFNFAKTLDERGEIKKRAQQQAAKQQTKTANAKAAAPAGKEKRRSIVDKLRISIGSSKKKGGKKQSLRRNRASLEKRKKKISLKRKSTKETIPPPEEDDEPVEAGWAFKSFFNQFTQSATDNIEYYTGFRWVGWDEESESDLESELYSDEDESDYDSDFDERFDQQLRAVGEQERIKAAQAWIEFEINRLIDIIHEIGIPDEDGNSVTTFGELLEVYEDISDTLVGILVRAKRAGRIYYARGAVGDMLFDGEDDDTEIVAFYDE